MLRAKRVGRRRVPPTMVAVVLGLLGVAGPADSAETPPAAMVVRVNGVPLSISSRILPGSPETLADRLADRWGERLAVPERSPAAARRFSLGRQRGVFHETLTLSAGPQPGTSLALVAVQDLRQPPLVPRKAPMGLPPGMRPVNTVEFGQAQGAPAAFTFDTALAPADALVRVAGAATAAGWKPLAAPHAERGGVGGAWWAQRGRHEICVVALRSGARARVVVLLTPIGGQEVP